MVRAAARTQSVTAEGIAAALRTFPGIATASEDDAGSRAHVDGDRVVFVLRFEATQEGEVARMVVDFIFSHMGEGRRLDSRTPIPAEREPLGDRAMRDSTRYACSHQQAANAVRMLRYASPRTQGPARPRTILRAQPLSSLLSHVFAAFDRDYEDARRLPQPSLGIWSNVLRAIPDAGLSRRELPKRTILSRRGASAVVRDLERLRWLTVEKIESKRGAAMLHLTSAGRAARDAAPKLIESVESDWETRFGPQRMATLCQALAALVAQFDIELPWYLTGYGLADASVTGGNHIAAKPGPPRIPHHGKDWPVVLRPPGNPSAAPSSFPLPALVSQALAAFTIDYEWDIFGYGAGLQATANLLQYTPDDGISLGDASARGDVRGNGKAGLERHLVVVVEPGRPSDSSRRVLLTPKGKRARDSHAHLLTQVERDWHERYGTCVQELRTTLESLDDQLGEGLPNYPTTTAWFFQSMVAGSAAARKKSLA